VAWQLTRHIPAVVAFMTFIYNIIDLSPVVFLKFRFAALSPSRTIAHTFEEWLM
jgi:hypothetical protein